ncbi:PHB depolymerase family esterase [Shimia sp.]|uniref:alpha/beta hydrolase family esterase n=1 Tax=Shimia sp. TaxID=1954381 RepID=UPI003564B3CF
MLGTLGLALLVTALLLLAAWAGWQRLRPPPGGDQLTVHAVGDALPPFLGGLSPLEKQAAGFGVETLTLRSGGRKRRFHFYMPPAAKRGGATGVLLVLHGGGGNALQFAHAVGAVQMANTHGFVIVAPQGYGAWSWLTRRGGWNADSVTRLGAAEVRKVDDLGFLVDLIRFARFESGVAPGRVFAMGVSKGGMMAYRLACAAPDSIAAIAVVAGTFSTDLCPEGAPVALLHIHGSDDENVPLEGGRGLYSANGADWPPVARGLEIFKRANGCDSPAETTRPAPDTTCQSFRDAAGETRVQFCLVEGGGHAWPGVARTERQRRRGIYVSRDFDASRHIARFFLDH